MLGDSPETSVPEKAPMIKQNQKIQPHPFDSLFKISVKNTLQRVEVFTSRPKNASFGVKNGQTSI